MSDAKTPDEIRLLFERHWIGSEDDLDTALEEFFKDIQSSLALVMDSEGVFPESRKVIQNTLDDYLGFNYF